MRKTIYALTVLITLFFNVNLYAAESAKPLDGIAAIVNDDVITDSELSYAVNIMKAQLRSSKMPVPEDAALRKEALGVLISTKLQMQIAKAAKLTISDSEVDAAVLNIANNNHISLTDLYLKLAESGMNEAEYKSQIHMQMLTQKLQQQEVAHSITVSNEEVKAFIADLEKNKPSVTQYRFDNLLLPVPDTASRIDILNAETRVNNISEKIQAGQTFQQIAASESQIKPALETHAFEFMSLDDMPSAYAEVIRDLKPNTYSKPIKTNNGFHILHLSETRSVKAETELPDDARAREILMMKKYDEAVKKWLKALHDSAYIQIM